jgi:UDP-N-acetylmuramoylalanine--D-glutamate ligase
MMREPAFGLLRKPLPEALHGKTVLVLGLGDTGLSVARWVESEGARVRAADTRATPPRRVDFRGELVTGPFTASLLEGVDLVCISPGLSLEEPLVREATHMGVPVLGDIELFAWHVRGSTRSKVVAVTGTNGKTTVTALTAHLLRSAGVDCESAGNIGPAALQALLARKAAPPAVWVLELSSYQLETTWSLAADASALLNVTEDHLDRYGSVEQYAAAKARIFMGDGVSIVNRDDARALALAPGSSTRMTFGLGAPPVGWDFGILDGALVQGREPFFQARELRIHGEHNVANALAACALARSMGVALQALEPGLASFAGLPHRLELVATRGGVEWYDDSKGTNVGATVAALAGLRKPVLLIAGGEGKGQDFSPLALPVSQFAKRVLLIGRDAPLIDQALGSTGVPVSRCASLEEAVKEAAREAASGDAVLLSPACASFDMFRDYRQRGEVFAAAVKTLPA